MPHHQRPSTLCIFYTNRKDDDRSEVCTSSTEARGTQNLLYTRDAGAEGALCSTHRRMLLFLGCAKRPLECSSQRPRAAEILRSTIRGDAMQEVRSKGLSASFPPWLFAAIPLSALLRGRSESSVRGMFSTSRRVMSTSAQSEGKKESISSAARRSACATEDSEAKDPRTQKTMTRRLQH